MLNIVIFGPPGAGKGTQSARLIEKYHLLHLSTGDILRGEIASGSILGQEAKLLMDQGMLVPDEIVITMINNKLQQNAHANGFVFDGFPRTTAQAEALDRLLNAKKMGITLTLALDISNEELIKRILQRGEELGRTDDQEISTIRNRIAEYANKTAPLKDYYKKQRKFYSVSGVGTIDEIFNSLCNTIDSNYHPEQTNGFPSIEEKNFPSAGVKSPLPMESEKVKVAPAIRKETHQEKEVEKITNTIAVQKKTAKPLPKKKAAKPLPKKKTAKSLPKKKTAKSLPKKKAAKSLPKKKVAKSLPKKKAAKSLPKKKAAKSNVLKKINSKKKNVKKATLKKVAGKKKSRR